MQVFKFTPDFMDAEQIEAITVGRKGLLIHSAEKIRSAARDGRTINMIFVGPRGIGKSHTALRLASELSGGGKMTLAQLSEEEYSVSSLDRFFSRVLDELGERGPDAAGTTQDTVEHGLSRVFDAAEKRADVVFERKRRCGVRVPSRQSAGGAPPSVAVRILAGDCAVRIDRGLERGIRPSHLAETLLKNQRKRSGFSPARFLESLYAVYSDIVSESESNKGMIGESGRVVPLARIYRLLTALPGVSRDYGRNDFARDLYAISTEGPRVTRRGYRVELPASTGTRRRADLFEFIAPDGQRITYYGVRFSEDAR